MRAKRATGLFRPEALEQRLVMSHAAPGDSTVLAHRATAEVARAVTSEIHTNSAIVVEVAKAGRQSAKSVVAAQSGPTSSILSLADDPILDRYVYVAAQPQAGDATSDVAADGAVSINALWESGQSPTWYIEEQRYGADLVTKGIVEHDDATIDRGLAELEWGFARQGPAGNFPGTSDAFHSTSFFVEAAARAMLTLRQGGDPDYQGTVAELTPKIEAAARWLMMPGVAAAGRSGDAPYTHRRYILAAALGETAALTGNQKMAQAAESYAKTGLSEQTRQGVNPEKGGYDVSYQALGILMAARYDTVCTDPKLRAGLEQMIGKGLDWELTKVGAQGEVSAVGSTRTGKEYGPAGNLKGVTYPRIVEAFTAGAAITGNRQFESTAELIASTQDMTSGS